jgi:hypothetical protein
VKSALVLSIMTTPSRIMEPTRSIRQSCNILVGMATDELNLDRNGKMDGMKSLGIGSVLKSGGLAT